LRASFYPRPQASYSAEGFPEPDRSSGGAQRAIFFVQRELESTGDADNAAIVLCDRGNVDGAAYWPGPDTSWDSLSTTLECELSRYDGQPPASRG
jgi:hypothetical protein